jgi:hypothetical protein
MTAHELKKKNRGKRSKNNSKSIENPQKIGGKWFKI